MARLINTVALMKRINRYPPYIRDVVEKELRFAPTVDPVKHGHWVEVQRIHETDRTAICECSLCGDTVWVYDGQRAWNYCPNCGAKMDEVTKDENDKRR